MYFHQPPPPSYILLFLFFLNQQQTRQLRASHDTTEHRDKARMIVDLSLWVTGKTAKVLDRAVKLAPVKELKTVSIKH